MIIVVDIEKKEKIEQKGKEIKQKTTTNQWNKDKKNKTKQQQNHRK